MESLKLLRPIHFSHDIGSEVRAVRRTFVRLHREQYQREKNRRALLRNAPFLSLDSIWQHNYAEQETLSLVLIFLKKTQLPDGIPNPRLMRFYEYLRKE
ncbi:MAG: hypothetical protein SGI94_20345 [Saprospiraceae bacterium]|nr:hypothetical protein [Saprospiraceae bacterium]